MFSVGERHRTVNSSTKAEVNKCSELRKAEGQQLLEAKRGLLYEPEGSSNSADDPSDDPSDDSIDVSNDERSQSPDFNQGYYSVGNRSRSNSTQGSQEESGDDSHSGSSRKTPTPSPPPPVPQPIDRIIFDRRANTEVWQNQYQDVLNRGSLVAVTDLNEHRVTRHVVANEILCVFFGKF